MEDYLDYEKENYPLLDDKRKEEIIKELENEIKNQIKINSKENKQNINNNHNSSTDEIKNQIDSNDINEQKEELNEIKNNLKEINETEKDANIIFNEINNFINDNNINIKVSENKNILNNEKNEEYCNLPIPQNQMNILISNKNNEKKNSFFDKINDKKQILFKKHNQKNIRKNNSFNINKKQINTTNSKNNIKNIKPKLKAKSTEKIKNNITKSNKSMKHKIIPNKKSKEKFKNIQIELNNKFKEDYPFKPKINSRRNKKNINETREQKYIRLSKPKTFELRGKNIIKTEEEKLNSNIELYNKKLNYINKINPKEVSNRLYKLHQQLREKKAQVKKIFEKKELDKCTFAPDINNHSKNIMNKTNNLSFNERNENYIKQRKENIIKLREEIDKELNEKLKVKNNEKIKTDENNVYDRLYENKYYSNMININLDTNDINEKLIQKNNINNKIEINDFLERQKIFENIKKERIAKIKLLRNDYENEKNDELTFQPKINSTSDLLAKTNPERIGEDANDKYKRLYDEAIKLKEKKEQLTEFYNAQYNFTPQINEISKIIGNNVYNIKNYLNKTISGDMRNNMDNIMPLDKGECTFKPEILNNEKYNSITSNYKFDENISQKIQEELVNRNKKINELKSEYFYENIKECKFVPETNKNIYNSKMHNINDDNYYQKGLTKYLEQMEKAKQAKLEKEKREKKVFITGENYNNNLNSGFKPFNLSKTNKRKNIDKIREEMKNEEMKECSFHPITNERKNKDVVKKILDENKK